MVCKTMINVAQLHKISHMSQFLHVDFNKQPCRAQAVLKISENSKSYRN